MRSERLERQDDFKFNSEKARSSNRESFLLVSDSNFDYYLKTKHTSESSRVSASYKQLLSHISV